VRRISCPRCRTSFTEAEKAWDRAVATGACPRCGTVWDPSKVAEVLSESEATPTPQGPDRTSTAFYANFPRRLNALTVDVLVIAAFTVLLSAVVLTPVVQDVTAARVGLTLGWWAIVLLYEPVLVWRGGGTIGHDAMNLRVVDNQTLGRISFPKALMRTALKILLGILSFFTMQFSRRHQALHDIATNSSVRIKRPEIAQVHHYTEGPE